MLTHDESVKIPTIKCHSKDTIIRGSMTLSNKTKIVGIFMKLLPLIAVESWNLHRAWLPLLENVVT
jgi:hypothetical protein